MDFFPQRQVFKDPTAPMQKALSTALSCGSEVMAMKLSQLSDGEKQPEPGPVGTGTGVGSVIFLLGGC